MYTAQRALDVIEARKEARNSFEAFCAFTDPSYIRAPHHREVCNAIDLLINGKINRLIVEKPPRHGKSFHISERLPAYFLGKFPDKHIIMSSHGDKMAKRFGRRVRNITSSDSYLSLFPGSKINPRADASDDFETEAGGRFITSGIHGGYMGTGGHLVGIDDPFKSRLDAESALIRDQVWEAFLDLETRLEPGSAMFVLHTRWHTDDLIGRITKERIESGMEKWFRIKQPMILNECPNWQGVEAGECSGDDQLAYERELALWPERYDIDMCRAIRRRTSRRNWVSLYQQEPTDAEGDTYQKSWFNRYDVGSQPDLLTNYIISDFAVTKKDGDWTEFYVVGLDKHGNVWFQDAWYDQERPNVWIKALVRLMGRWNPWGFFGETGQIRRAIEPFLETEMNVNRVYCELKWLSTPADKVARSQSSVGMASMGKFHIPRCDWGDRLVEQLVMFPNSKMDHSCDAVSLIGRAINDGMVYFPVNDMKSEEDRLYDSYMLKSQPHENGWRVA